MTEAGREKQISLLNESFTESCRHPPTGGGTSAGPAGAPSPWLTASIDPGLKSVGLKFRPVLSLAWLQLTDVIISFLLR